MAEQQSPDRTILVIDDEPVNIQVLSRKLKWEGLGVLTAKNGREGLELAKSGSPDLILLDIMMPGMDGFEVCQKLREDERTKSIPVIFVTAQNSKQGKLEGLKAGAVDYITKPIDLEETTARIRSQLKYLAINQENIELTKRLGESRRAASIGALTQGIAHNLNNLLGVVMGYLELAKANHKDAEKVLHNLTRVEGAANRIVGIIKQLSTVAFTTKLSLHSMLIDKLIANSIERANEIADGKIVVDIDNQLDGKSIRTNIEAFEDALSKLILNAWESYIPTKKEDRPIWLNVQFSKDSQNVVFQVIDQGNGIDSEVEDNMFEPFVSTKNTVGVGMGLTIARHAVRTLGGEIRISKNEECGVTAEFTHPYLEEDTFKK